MDNTITITTNEYRELLRDQFKFEIIKNMLIKNARLNYNKTGLTFDVEDSIVMKLFEMECADKFIELKEEVEA